VLGVVIVFIISAMFILGLENSRVFGLLLVSSVLTFVGLIAIVTYLRGDVESWTHDSAFPQGFPGVSKGLQKIKEKGEGEQRINHCQSR
jgi:hypothetical protein